ncbi:MAG: hypothetical protein DDT19_01845 [Syntrophomonadaceae bacterium]|nr:hypothetical protein [Bacillota bacterium]
MYVWHPWDGTDTSYGKTYRETEVLFGARKATRWFETDEAEAGHKCSLCGSRQALHLSTTGPNRSDIREFWKDGLKLKLNRDIQYRFKEGEHLCAVCTVKRLAPEWVFGKILDIPSTSSVAVSEFIKRIGDKVAQLGGRLISKFSQDVEDLASLVGEPKKVDPMPLLEKEYRDALPSLIHLDGDWFYEDTYESLRAKIKDFVHLQGNSAPVINAQESLEEVVNALRSLEGDTFRPPTKYFCILSADGDSMGRVLANVSSLQNHRDLSGRLASFAGASVVQLLQDDHLGYVVYFGGDEGVAFVALEDLFKVMKALRDVWEEQVMRPLQSVLSSPPTLSVGAVIAHHQHGLRFSLREARSALEYAKKMEGKDAFGVTILRRSGSPSQTRAKWRYLSPSIEVLEVLAAHQDAYRKEILSPRWLNDLRGEALAICGRLPHDYSEAKELCDYEIKRLIRRHWTDPNGLPPDNLIAQTLGLHEAIWGPVGRPNERRFEDFVGLMDLAFYVARGGGY